MRSRDTVIVFTRLPRLGTVKTRIARVHGAVAARLLHRRLVLRAVRRLVAVRRWRVVLAVTPDGGGWREWPRALPRITQGRGDLGRRMGRCLVRCARPRAVLVGTDIPELSTGAVARAFQALGRRRFVFGPAEDGGYWLIGWRRGAAWPWRALSRVRWSTAQALADSMVGLGPAALVDCLGDLDDLADRGLPPEVTRPWSRL